FKDVGLVTSLGHVFGREAVLKLQCTLSKLPLLRDDEHRLLANQRALFPGRGEIDRRRNRLDRSSWCRHEPKRFEPGGPVRDQFGILRTIDRDDVGIRGGWLV